MKQTLTLVCKLHPTPEQVAKIEVTFKAFADACNYANQVVKPNVTNKVVIQAQAYQSYPCLRGIDHLSVNSCRSLALIGLGDTSYRQQ